ncbi:MAG TPA: ROK family protein [Pyrinomonadaceae bacterium]|nr:ROK family protein [Pyrinomonadaceae bacterium]
MTETSCVLAGDVGGTNLRVAVVANDGSILHRLSVDTPQTGDISDIEHAIHTAALSCIEAVSDKCRPVAFGLALAALVNYRESLILSSPNLPELNSHPLAANLSSSLGLKVVLENDAMAAAIGEHWLGASAEAEHSIFITLGTGVGGGLILNGEPFRGADGTAGEVGHICVEPDGVQCGCGSHGCLEQYGSATAIIRMAKERGFTLDGDRPLTAAGVYGAGKSGDQVAIGIFRDMGRYLGLGLASLVNVLNPELIVIGGGVARGWDLFIHSINTEIATRAFKHPGRRVRLIQASLGDSAGILGAARVAFDQG